ncbi:MAG: hypothetical protein LBT93_04160 [Treponema sp.]|nr:hypothetical protein [Treponema sp.]
MYLDEYNIYQSVEQALLEYQNRQQTEEPVLLSGEDFKKDLPVYILSIGFIVIFAMALVFCALTGF